MKFTPDLYLESSEGSLPSCHLKRFWKKKKFARFCPHQSHNIPGIKSALGFKNKTGGTNWIRSPWQTSPPKQNVLSIGEIAIKEMYIFSLPFLHVLISQLYFSILDAQRAGVHLSTPPVSVLPPALPQTSTSPPPSAHTVYVHAAQGPGQVVETGEGRAAFSCEDCQVRNQKIFTVFSFLLPLFFFCKYSNPL